MRRLLLLLLFVVSLPLAAQTPYLVKDINTTYSDDTKSSAPSEFAALGSRTFFVATTDAAGTELWSTDGTSAGTSIVSDIIPGTASSSPSLLQAVNGVLLFDARDVNHGTELWATDGTAAGTHLLMDINPGANSSQPGTRILYKNRLLFSADDGTNGRELWTSDGTAAGTRMVKDLNPGSASSNPTAFVLFGDNVYFSATGGLWKTDGTDTGTVKIASVTPRNPVVSGSQFFFEGFTSTTNWELWVSDGSDAGTHMVTEIYPGTNGALNSTFNANNLAPFHNGVLFAANDGVHGREMWFSDGTVAGTRMVRDFLPGATGMWDGSNAYITILANRAYFVASDAEHGQEVWSTDGTDAGSALFADLVPGTQSSFPLGLTVAFGKLYFLGGGTYPIQPLLWVTDGTPGGTQPVSAAFGVDWFYVFNVVWPINGKLYFSGSTPVSGREPWVSDGTAAGSRMIANLAVDRVPSADPFWLTAAGDLLFFEATEGFLSPSTNIAESSLWRTDGTEAGTFKLKETGQNPGMLIPTGAPLVFFQEAENNTGVMKMSDGTVAGTKAAADFMLRFGPYQFTTLFPFGETLFAAVSDDALWKTTAAPNGTATKLGARKPRAMIEFNGQYAFYAQGPQASSNYGLWVTDGTPAGTYAVVPDLGDMGGQNPGPLVNAQGTLFFLKTLRNGKLTLWKSDGTFDGTVAVKELPTTIAFDAKLKAAGRNVFFYTQGSIWFSDGTEGGTREVAKIAGASSDYDGIRVAGDRIVYTTAASASNYELWGSDGTTAGTRLLKVLGTNYTTLTSIDGVVYFSGNDDAHGSEIWTTDGTVEGTKLIADVNPGPASSNPSQFTKVGNLIYFTAYTDATGTELWALPLTTPGLSIAGAHGTEGDTGTALIHFTVSLAPAAKQTVTVDYATSDGTAKAGDDYDAASGTITFAAGETVKTIDVRVRGDVTPENNKTFFVTLRNAAGASLISPVASGIIDDDDQFADLSIAPQFGVFANEVADAARVSNAGPRAATDVVVTLTTTPRTLSFTTCSNCLVGQLSSGASASASTDSGEFSQQVYVSATASARQRDPQPSNNAAAWTVNAFRTMAMNATYLTPGATATITASVSSSGAAVTSSDPTVVSVPSQATNVTSTLATIAITALKPGTSTISVQGNLRPLLVTVIAPGTQPRWPGGVTMAGDFTARSLDEPLMVTVAPSGTAPFSAAKATGTVVVTAAGRELARAAVGTGSIKFPVYFQSLGSVAYAIDYSGDANFLPQTTNATVFVTPGRVTITGGLERTAGTAGTYTLTVHAAGSPAVAPTGTLSILNGAVEVATVTLVPSAGGISTAHATLTNLSTSPTLTINYAGDALYQSGSQQVRVVEARQRSAHH